jgi:cobyrinic acid a,c-diamide synthase
MKSIIIAAPHSGAGKTTITIGIMECLRRRGLIVAPFKVGPDFIDPGYHRLVTGRSSVNLDGWLCGAEFVRETFAHHQQNADIAVIEGVMGLFDGISGGSEAGSTAQIAKLTGSPVVLVLDAKSMARSAAALVKGFVEFDPELNLAGVIFNNVASDNHGSILRQAIGTALPEVKVLGCIPRDERLHIPSRHLGLLSAAENPLPKEFLDHLVEVIRETIDLGLLWTLATPHAIDQELPFAAPRPAAGPVTAVRIAVAQDEAFCFVYEDNLRLLRDAGGELVGFSPLRDEALPAGIAGVYLPGGYPEVFSDTLAANVAMKKALRAVIEAGMPVYAECGGFIYLTQGVVDAKNEPESLHECVAVFPVTTRMLPRRKALGYREIEIGADSIIGPRGTVARGHEFHYSVMAEMPPAVERIYQVRKNGADLGTEGFRHKNCLASYIHLHFGSCPGLAEAFVEFCRKFKSI